MEKKDTELRWKNLNQPKPPTKLKKEYISLKKNFANK